MKKTKKKKLRKSKIKTDIYGWPIPEKIVLMDNPNLPLFPR